MLVLTRKTDESIIIGDSIEIKVLACEGNSIKLGIKAPRSVPVHRKEIYEEIVRENKASTAQTQVDLDSLKKMFVK